MFFTALLLMFALGSQVKVSEGNNKEDGAIAILQNEILAEVCWSLFNVFVCLFVCVLCVCVCVCVLNMYFFH